MQNTLIGLTLSFFVTFASANDLHKALDGHAIVCNQQNPTANESVIYDKALRMQVIEQALLEDVAEATIQVRLVEDPCVSNDLDPAPRTFGDVFVETYTLTVATPEGKLLFQQDLPELTEKSIETLTFGIPAIYAKSRIPLEIGIQVRGRVSTNREMFDPYQGRFGVFNFRFKNFKNK